MQAITFFERQLGLNLLYLAVSAAVYVSKFGVDGEIVDYLGYGLICGAVMYVLTGQLIRRRIVPREKGGDRVGCSPLEARMMVVLGLLPLAFLLLTVAAVEVADHPLGKVGWMFIAMAVSAGQNLEALVRFRQEG